MQSDQSSAKNTISGLVKSVPVVNVRNLARNLDDTGGALRLTEHEAKALVRLMTAPMERYSRDLSLTEIDAVEQLFVRIEVTLGVRRKRNREKGADCDPIAVETMAHIFSKGGRRISA